MEKQRFSASALSRVRATDLFIDLQRGEQSLSGGEGAGLKRVVNSCLLCEHKENQRSKKLSNGHENRDVVNGVWHGRLFYGIYQFVSVQKGSVINISSLISKRSLLRQKQDFLVQNRQFNTCE